MTKPQRAPVTPRQVVKTETRWVELTDHYTRGRVFRSSVGAMSEPGESRAEFIDRECCEPGFVVKVTLSYPLPRKAARDE